MPLIVDDVINIMEQYAPMSLKESYDNVGLMIGEKNSEISFILVSLDCTLGVIDEAIEKGCNLIFTHHPLLFKKPASITDETLLGRKIIKLVRSNINVFSSHTNLDSVNEGVNDIIMQLLGFEKSSVIEPATVYNEKFKTAGIGRIAVIKENIVLSQLIERVKKSLGIKILRFCGNENLIIRKVAVINGSGQDYFEAAKELGADCIITGDTSYHYVSDYSEENIAIIDAGHFNTEWPAMKLVADYLQKKIIEEGFNNAVLMSECNFDPYKFK